MILSNQHIKYNLSPYFVERKQKSQSLSRFLGNRSKKIETNHLVEAIQFRSLYSMLYRDYTPRIDVCVDSTTQTLKKAQLTTVVNANNKQAFMVYPNPSMGEIWLKFERVPDNKVEINVYSIEGTLVHSEKTADTKINHNFSNGIYFIHVKTSDGYQYSPQRVTIIN